MGNLESAAKVNIGQLEGSCSRELDLSRSLTYEKYQQHMKSDDPGALHEFPQDLLSVYSVSFYEKLNFAFNCITAVPYEFSMYLPHLVHLDLSYNRIGFLPDSFGYLFHLETLFINNNKLRELPDTFCYLARLQKLDLSHNQLLHLPENIGLMESLLSINVSYNELEALPASISKSKTLKLILAIFNNCSSPPQQICNQGSETILAFFGKSQKNGKDGKTGTQGNEFARVRGDVLSTTHSNLHTARAQYVQTQTNVNAMNRIKTPLRPPPDGTKMPPDELVDKVVGCLYGAAIGDAIGLCTEFMLPDECRFYYEMGDLSYEQMVRDRHRCKWQKGDWTDSFDQMVLLLDNVLSWAGVVDELEFAKTLLSWCKHGFPELGDTVGRGVRGLLAKVVCEPSFSSDPHGAARKVSDALESPTNGAVMRTAVLGLTHFFDLNEVASNAVRICKATNYDSRCVASCVVVSTLVASILQGTHNLSDRTSLEQLIGSVKEKGSSYLTEAHHQKDFNHYFDCKTWQDIEVCEPRMTDYTFKPLAAAIVALRAMDDFRPTITQLAMQGGHATCNATVAGAVLGCKLGYAQLPKEWLNGLLPKQVSWLNGKINALLDMMALP
ncbi:uncharacterized protein LOC5513573 isoform X2 [Nematostella vectensis]|uniref:uncharacterized protein LOC5513573 isoform X2 n=1 Tax=Nematostella vectensis TaxID=45351 RepID=UPI00138FB1A8|nr:uncharacterized protein LOC5513573 isoform X2 [Nematostella vectensis]